MNIYHVIKIIFFSFFLIILKIIICVYIYIINIFKNFYEKNNIKSYFLFRYNYFFIFDIYIIYE